MKASGLAAGKGVIVANNKQEACQAVRGIVQVTSTFYHTIGDLVLTNEVHPKYSLIFMLFLLILDYRLTLCMPCSKSTYKFNILANKIRDINSKFREICRILAQKKTDLDHRSTKGMPCFTYSTYKSTYKFNILANKIRDINSKFWEICRILAQKKTDLDHRSTKV